jgi:hypothetical protein
MGPRRGELNDVMLALEGIRPHAAALWSRAC